MENGERRYSDREVRAIIARAADIQRRELVPDAADAGSGLPSGRVYTRETPACAARVMASQSASSAVTLAPVAPPFKEK